jgi:uncharacterized membrane protein YcaP (DUF421 family)
MWFDGWSDVVRVILVGAVAYMTLVVVLRVSGKRTLSKLNAFDLVVTIAVGSTLATILLNADVSYAEGFAALSLLAALQFLVALVSTRSAVGRGVLTARPTLVHANGRMRDEALGRQRLCADDIRQAVRTSGSGDLASVAAVILESDGSLSVISADRIGDGSALEGVAGADTVTWQEGRVGEDVQSIHEEQDG